MKKTLLIFALLIGAFTYGQNTMTNALSHKGLTTTQRGNLSTTGLYPVLYNTTTEQFERWNGTAYERWTAGVTSADIANGTIVNADINSGIDAAKISGGSISNTEFNYLDGLSSSIQNQINGKINNTINSVTAVNILDESIGELDIGTGAVNTDEILDGGVGEADLNVSINASLDLADSAVQNADINSFSELNGLLVGEELVNISSFTAPNALKYARFSGENTIEGLTAASVVADLGVLQASDLEGTAILSTGETGGTKYLREDGDGTSSWQTVVGGGGDDVSTFAEKTGALVGTDRLVGLSGTTDFNETISGIPLSIFNDDLTHTAASTDDQTAAEVSIADAGVIITATDVEGALQENRTAIDVIEDIGIIIHPSSPNDLSSIYIGTVGEIGGAGLGPDVLAIPTNGSNNLDDLDDVNTATITSGNILVADGVDFESVAVSGDATMTNAGVVTVTDIAPAAEIDLGANSIGGTAQTATGDGTTTIDWGSGNFFHFQFGAFNETFTFTAPTKPGTFILKLVQDSVGSRTATWPATIEWPSGTAPTLTTTATTGTDIITFYFDGTDYFAVSSLDFQ